MLTWREMAGDLLNGHRIELMKPLEGRWPRGSVLTVKSMELNEITNCIVFSNHEDDSEDVVSGPQTNAEWDEECDLFKIVEYAQNG